MRDYARVSPQFWTGHTGRQLRTLGPVAQVVAMYLVTCPSANMIGLYYLPIPTLCHETGIPIEGATEALQSLAKSGFAYRDAPSEMVFVPEMARFQIGETLKPGDKRILGVIRELEAYKKCGFAKDFHARYASAYHLPPMPDQETLKRLSKGPSEPHRSQDQDQDQEQEQEGEQDQPRAGAHVPPPIASLDPKPEQIALVAGQQRRLALDIVGMWNAAAATAEPSRAMVRNAEASMATLLRAVRHRPSLTEWEEAHEKTLASDYLMGRVAGRDGGAFHIDFWWFIEHVDKILAGRYDNRRAAPAAPAAAGVKEFTGPAVPDAAASRAFLARMKQGGARA